MSCQAGHGRLAQTSLEGRLCYSKRSRGRLLAGRDSAEDRLSRGDVEYDDDDEEEVAEDRVHIRELEGDSGRDYHSMGLLGGPKDRQSIRVHVHAVFLRACDRRRLCEKQCDYVLLLFRQDIAFQHLQATSVEIPLLERSNIGHNGGHCDAVEQEIPDGVEVDYLPHQVLVSILWNSNGNVLRYPHQAGYDVNHVHDHVAPPTVETADDLLHQKALLGACSFLSSPLFFAGTLAPSV